jgi:YD repeat-containing protein
LNALFAVSQTTYQYDNLNRLSKVTYSNGITIDYVYDELGNRTKKTVAGNSIAVTGVSLDKTAITLLVNGTDQLTATVDPDNATNKSVTWSSNDPLVATVDNGLVTGVAAGTATITVTADNGNQTATCAVTVNPSPPLSVSLSSVPFTASGGQQTFNITSNVGWTVSSSASWLTVSPASGSNNGTVTLTAFANNGSSARTATVTVSGTDVSDRTVSVTQEALPVVYPNFISLYPTEMKLAPGEKGQLSANVLPGNATDRSVTWSSNNRQVAVVSSDGLVTAVSTGYAVITAGTVSGNLTATCSVTVEEQGIVVLPDDPANGQGNIEISLNIPVNEPFSVSFTLTLPTGFNLDQIATSLVSELQGSHQLTISPAGTGNWLFEIKPKTSPRSANEMMYQQVVHIVYTLDATATAGDYEVTVSNVNLTLDDGTTVHQDEISVSVTFDGTTGIESIGASQVWFYSGILHVNTPAAERVDVYSVSGLRLYSAWKAEGEAGFNLNDLPRGVLIVRGSSGWTGKIVK